MKAKVKPDLIRYYWSEEIKAKRLTSAASNTVSVVEVEDTEDSSADDQEPNDISVAFLLESQHGDNPGEVRMVNEPQDRDEVTTHQLDFTSDMTDSENLHVQNECETDVCVTE